MICAWLVITASSAVRPAAVSGSQKCATAGLSKPWLTAVTFAAISAWLTWVLRINSAFTTEMPTLEPTLRNRL